MNIELKINGKEVELSEETKEKIKKACGQVKIRPKDGENYFYIGSVGSVYSGSFYKDNPIDNNIFKSGIGFFTEEEAEKELAKRQAIQRVKDYIKENGMYLEPDWNDNSDKYFFDYYFSEDKIGINSRSHYKHYSPIGYLKSAEDAKKVLEDNKEDLELIYK